MKTNTQQLDIIQLFGGLILCTLNVLDTAMTLKLIGMGVAKEANPLMRLALESSPYVFVVLKVGVANVLALFLGHLARKSKVAYFGLIWCIAAYSLLVAYQTALLLIFA